MLTVYGYVPAPAWGKGIPDISPYVTKLIYYLKITKTPFEYKSQSLPTLDSDSPYGKLPYIIDDDNTKVGDSNQIIEYLERKHGITLDKGLNAADKALCLAFERLIGEHLYWSGIIEPRWRSDQGWEVYIPYIVQGAEVGPELRGALDAFRTRILAGFDGQGMGRRDSDYVAALYKTDLDALSDYLGSKRYLMGQELRRIDVALYAMLRHLVDQPQKWPGTGYIESKDNLVAYMANMRAQFDI